MAVDRTREKCVTGVSASGSGGTRRQQAQGEDPPLQLPLDFDSWVSCRAIIHHSSFLNHQHARSHAQVRGMPVAPQRNSRVSRHLPFQPAFSASMAAVLRFSPVICSVVRG